MSERIAVQPGRATASGGARFTGALEDLAVADLLQILQLAGKSALITVIRNGAHSYLWCSAGELIDAESGRLRGEAAVNRILGFSEGWLIADLRPAASTRTIFGSMQQVLLEAARQRDEASALRRKLGDLQRCYRLGKSLSPDELAGLGSAEAQLLRSCTDAPSLCELLEESELGELATLVALDRWIEAGNLVPAGLRFSAHRSERASAITARTPHSLRAPVARSRITRIPAPSKGPRARTWAWAALGVLAFFASGYIVRGRTTRHAETIAQQARAAEEAAPRPVASYSIALQVEPENAEIWLDHQPAGVGSLSTRLPRDGVAHELRVAAAGFAPAAVVFVDAAPPAQLRLEPWAPTEGQLPLPAPACASPAAPAEAAQAAGQQKTPRRPGRGSATLRQEPRPKLHDSSARSGKPRGTPPAEQPAPIIGSEEPVVRVLD